MRNNGYLQVRGDLAKSETNVPQTSDPRNLRPGEPVSQFERSQMIRSSVNREIRKLGARREVVYVLHAAVPIESELYNKHLPFIQSPGVRFSEGGDLLDANAAGGGVPAWNTRKGVGRGTPYRLSEYRTKLAYIHGFKSPFSK